MSSRKRPLRTFREGTDPSPAQRPRLDDEDDMDMSQDDNINFASTSQQPRSTGSQSSVDRRRGQTSNSGTPSEPNEPAPEAGDIRFKIFFGHMISHVYLPPELPDTAPDKHIQKEIDEFILAQFSEAAAEFGSNLPQNEQGLWGRVTKCLQTMTSLYSLDDEEAWLSSEKLQQAFKNMHVGDFLILYIRCQNAGIIIRRMTTEVILEMFEASPLAEAVSACRNKLLFSFPGPRTSIPVATFVNPHFRRMFSTWLFSMDSNVIEMRNGKRGSVNDASAASPAAVTELLVAITRGLGKLKTGRESDICKRVGDVVLGSDSVWRRSPFWLVLRVGLHTTIKLQEPGSFDLYKCFMAYFMTKMIKKALKAKCETSQYLYIMGAKVSRRIYKIRDHMPDFLRDEATSTMGALSKFLKFQWDLRRQTHVKQITWNPEELNVLSDCNLQLTKSRPHISNVFAGGTDLTSLELRHGNFFPDAFVRILDPIGQGSVITSASKKELRTLLMDIEMWVDKNIDDYVKNESQNPAAVLKLRDVHDTYFTMADREYDGNPESLSIAFLTGFEIWVAMDKITTNCIPLLAKYHPEIKDDSLDKLLLPTHRQMHRLSSVQRHIQDRAMKADSKKATLFKNKFNEGSFQVQYFASSVRHQDLLIEVTQAATVARTEVIQNLNEINREYVKIMREAAALDHELTPTGRHRTAKGKCERCNKENEARKLSVGKHEWPVPRVNGEDVSLTKAVIFELECPKHFAAWRDVTFRMKVNVSANLRFTEMDTEVKVQEKLSTYSGLRNFYNDNRRSGIVLASSSKSLAKDNQAKLQLPADEEEVQCENGLTFGYYYQDGHGGHWVKDFLALKGKWDRRMFSYTLPDNSLYKPLQFALRRSDHSTNDVLALQHKCPPRLSSHEFYEYGALRAGGRIQWLNIAKALKARVLALNKPEVGLLILQAAWECGRPIRGARDIFLRDVHRLLNKGSIIKEILDEIESVLESIETNWLELVVMATLVALNCRCLVFIKECKKDFAKQAMALLLRLRKTTYRWLEELRSKIAQEQDEKALNGLLVRLMHCAAVCRMTYEVPEDFAVYSLDGLDPLNDDSVPDPKQLSIYIETGAIIRDNVPSRREYVEEFFRFAIERSNRLSHRLEEYVRNLILSNSDGLDMAIETQWRSHRRTGLPKWKAIPSNEHWVQGDTYQFGNGRRTQISLNLLDGQILIDSIPFGRLPFEYTSHPTYDRVFGDTVLMVGPSSMDGMQFETRFPINGHRVYLGFKDERLIIRSQINGTTYELIPEFLFEDDIPVILVSSYTHWVNPEASEIQFRKLIYDPFTKRAKESWDVENPEYLLSFDTGLPVLSKIADPGVHILDPESATARQIYQLFTVLKEEKDMLVTARKDPITEEISIEVDIPILNLKFMSDGGSFISQNFPGFTVDENQDIGCFYGLSNQLVLAKGEDRMILVPFGNIKLRTDGEFTVATIQEATSYQAYTVDRHLGRLTGNGSTSGRLFQIYLHAITSSSSCQVDGLTGRSGTEEATSLLMSGATCSFQELESHDIDLLHLISKLTPHRSFAPNSNDKVKRPAPQNGNIEHVLWNPQLSFNVQRDAFRVGAKIIISHWMRIKKFVQRSRNPSEDLTKGGELDDGDTEIDEALADKQIEEGVDRGNDLLLRRACKRHEVFYASENVHIEEGLGIVSEDDIDILPPIQDMTYTARHAFGDTLEIQSPEPEICQIAQLLKNWTVGMEPKRIWTALKSFKLTGVKGRATSNRLSLDDRVLKRSFGEVWGPLFEACRQSNQRDHLYDLVFILCTLAFREGFDALLVHTLVGAAVLPELKGIEYQLPNGHFEIAQGAKPDVDLVRRIIEKNSIPFETTRFMSLPRQAGESEIVANERRKTQYRTTINIQRSNLLDEYCRTQWPRQNPEKPRRADFNLIRLESVHPTMTQHFANVYKNYQLKQVVNAIQGQLDLHQTKRCETSRFTFEACRDVSQHPEPDFALETLLNEMTPPSANAYGQRPAILNKVALTRSIRLKNTPQRVTELRGLSDSLLDVQESRFNGLYATDLAESITALEQFKGQTSLKELPIPSSRLPQYTYLWKSYVQKMKVTIQERLSPQSPDQKLIHQAGMWPRLTNFGFFKLLSPLSVDISDGWRRTITAYGLALRELRRAERLEKIAKTGDIQAFWEALPDTKNDNWDALDYPEWLLLELENDLCIREVQAEIASEMIQPQAGRNSVMQLNMGEGKSSVIIPAVASSLANGEQLVRVLVLKPLSREMFNILRSRLGDLCSRRIYYLPFQRGLPLDRGDVKRIQNIHEECMYGRGIFLVQHEHALSFKLLGIDHVCSEGDSPDVGILLYDVQKWLNTNTRDLLDESDEILKVNHSLIYTVGTQGPMDNQPHRWTYLLRIFDILSAQAPAIKALFPNGIEFTQNGEGTFPFIRIIQKDAGESLMNAIATEIVYGNSPGCDWLSSVPEEDRKIILKFITIKDLPSDYSNEFKAIIRGGDTYDAALLFRGLIAFSILTFCLQEKRYRVDYGHDWSRTLLAVPYKAKDTPSAASDFAHPEVLLTLTCLSWYYAGLTEGEVKECMELILESDHPDDEYASWTRRCHDLPPHLKSWKGANVDNTTEFKEVLYPILKDSKAVIDFYLEQRVFPKYAKQFSFKLVSSGWDLVEEKPNITTGFSGTNDNKYLLPLSIHQSDLPTHKHTNALVLNYLLGPENNNYISATGSMTDGKMSIEAMLDVVVSQSPPVSVILDVGAQILELTNDKLVKLWLEKAARTDPERWQAAIFFNTQDQLCVVDRDGRVELLMTSSYAKQMEKCLCYLDDAHTRGTDLKFPVGTRGLVTLGPKTTKDQLIQGVMRLRKLGKGHSVTFMAPTDVESRILSLADKGGRKRTVETVDILRWSLLETCKQTTKNVELWAAQGVNHAVRKTAENLYDEDENVNRLKNFLFEKEEQSLKDLYRPEKPRTKLWQSGIVNGPPDHPFAVAVRRITTKCHSFGVGLTNLASQDLNEEQEREVEQEVEVQREVYRPPPAKPLMHQKVHKDLVKFVNSGNLSMRSDSVEPALASLRRTSLRHLIRPGPWSADLLVSLDFTRTVELKKELEGGQAIDHQDDFLRPVCFILSKARGPRTRTLFVIISPFEANELLDAIKGSTKVKMHIYMPKTTKSMPSFENLQWLNVGRPYPRAWSVPALLMDQLNLFAGQLYFRDRAAYIRTARWLCLRSDNVDPSAPWEEDGYIPVGYRRLMNGDEFGGIFEESPVHCLQMLASIRRRAQRYESTHVGQMLHGKIISLVELPTGDSDFEILFNESEEVTADNQDNEDYLTDVIRPLQQSQNGRGEARQSLLLGSAVKAENGDTSVDSAIKQEAEAEDSDSSADSRDERFSSSDSENSEDDRPRVRLNLRVPVSEEDDSDGDDAEEEDMEW